MGDSDSVGEELLDGISELEERARVVSKAVKEGYFTLEEALMLYKITLREYNAQVFSLILTEWNTTLDVTADMKMSGALLNETLNKVCYKYGWTSENFQEYQKTLKR